jgi:hypothetical protein
MHETKQALYDRGVDLLWTFCEANGLKVPEVKREPPAGWPFGVCAYYRADRITICVEKCAAIGVAGMAWSFPGHSVDRTPYGVIAHELGHHVDLARSTRRDRYRGDFSLEMRARCAEAPLTSYCPDDGEWFAEMFRLFVTNPDLLHQLRPRTFRDLLGMGFVPVFDDPWYSRLAEAPERTVQSIINKLAKRR